MEMGEQYPSQAHYDAIHLGEETQRFFNSSIGKYIEERASSEERNLISVLKKTPPTSENLEKLQVIHQMLETVSTCVQWLYEAIHAGELIRKNLEAQDQELEMEVQ